MRNLWRLIGFVGFVGVAVAGLAVSDAEAQTPSEPEIGMSDTNRAADVFRLVLGIGAGSLSSPESGGIALRAAARLSKWERRVLTVRFTAVDEFALFTSPSENVWDLGVLYGSQTVGKNGYASASAGIALVGGMRRGELLSSGFLSSQHAEHPFHTVGIPLEIEAGWTFSSAFGLGVTLFGNLNPERTAVGASVNVLLRDLSWL